MSTRPITMSLDTLAMPHLRDMMAARSSDLPRDQHALMTAFGGPEQVRSVYYFALASTPATYYPGWRVPPGVTEAGIGLLVAGNGTITITVSGVDATGTSFTAAAVYDATPSPEAAVRLFNGSPLTAEDGAPGRALTVRTAASWQWTNVEMTLTITPDPELYIYEMSFAPIHVPRNAQDSWLSWFYRFTSAATAPLITTGGEDPTVLEYVFVAFWFRLHAGGDTAVLFEMPPAMVGSCAMLAYDIGGGSYELEWNDAVVGQVAADEWHALVVANLGSEFYPYLDGVDLGAVAGGADSYDPAFGRELGLSPTTIDIAGVVIGSHADLNNDDVMFADHYALGVTHNPLVAAGEWLSGVTLLAAWIDEDVAGTVPNEVGNLGSTMTLDGTSEEL